MLSYSLPASQPGLPFALFGALVIALAGLVVAFAVSFHLADRQFQLASLAERQATAVARIAAARDGAARSTAIAHYNNLIAAETTALADEADVPHHQAIELADAKRLGVLASDPAAEGMFRALADRISHREDGEVRGVRAELDHLHTRTVALAALLAIVALLCAVSGGWLMLQRTRSLEAMVRARTQEIEEVDRSRRLFFAKASHELRTPVSAMRGEAEVALANDHANDSELRQSLRHLLANATFLGHRIDELLGLARADNGKLQLVRESVDLASIVQSVVAEAGSFALSVEVRIAASGFFGPVPAQGDARWLRQALLAVVENGLKFSPMGGVLTISLAREGNLARISVADDGPGVMPLELPRIFDAYYQTDAGRSRGGSGLGLALSRWVAEQHGGAIVAENRQEGGCRIVVTLPLEQNP